MNRNPMSLPLVIMIAILIALFINGSDYRWGMAGLVFLGLVGWVFMARVTVGPQVMAMADLDRHFPSDDD